VALAKRAKILSEKQEQSALRYVAQNSRYIQRDTVIFLLSTKAGLRAKEISCLTWSMITDAQRHLSDRISLENKAAKGRSGGRSIPMNEQLKSALIALMAAEPTSVHPDNPV